MNTSLSSIIKSLPWHPAAHQTNPHLKPLRIRYIHNEIHCSDQHASVIFPPVSCVGN